MRSWTGDVPQQRNGLLVFLMILATLAGSALAGLRPGRWSTVLAVLVGGGAGLALLLQQPAAGLVAMAALSFTLPLELGTGSAVSLTPPVLLIAALAGVWLLQGLQGRSLRLPRSRTVLPLLLFVASGLVSLLAGRSYWNPLVPQPGNLTLVQLGQWALYALSAAIFLLAAEWGQEERWLRLATFTFLTLAGITALLWFVPELWNVLSWGGQANSGMLWAWLGGLGTGQLLFNRRLGTAARLGLAALLVAGAYNVWFIQRTWVSGWVPFTVAAVAVVWLRVWRGHRAAGVVVALLLLGLAVVLYPVLFEHAGGEREFISSWGGRQALYRAVLDTVKEHPVLGLGPAAYRHYALTRWLSLGAGRALYLRPAVSSHNNYLDIYAGLGLVGLVLFLWFLFEVGRQGWRLAPRFRGDFRDGYVHGAIGGFAGTLVAMMLVDWFLPFVYNVGFPGFRTSSLAWMFLGGLVALEQVTRIQEEGTSDG